MQVSQYIKSDGTLLPEVEIIILAIVQSPSGLTNFNVNLNFNFTINLTICQNGCIKENFKL